MSNAVADALKVIADALTTKTETKEEVKAEPQTFYAVYQTVTYLPVDYNGGYITDPEKLAVYYKLNPAYKPSDQKTFDIKTAGAPRYVVTATKGNEEVAKKTALEAIAGLKLLCNNGNPKSTGCTYDYKVVTIKEGIE